MVHVAINKADKSQYDVVIGVPAKWDKSKRKMFKELAGKVGFKNVSLLPEPIAAILYAKFYEKIKDIKKDSYFLFFDFGGGTLDLSLIKMNKNGKIKFIYTGGNPNLGGRNFDETLTEYFYEQGKKEGFDVNKEVEIEIEKQVRDNKAKLNEEDNKKLQIYLRGETLSITKNSFKNICKKHIDKIQESINNFFLEIKKRNIKIKKRDISEVIKVGGASKMFFVDNLLKKTFNNDININNNFEIINPSYAVVKGLPLYLKEREKILEKIEPKIKSSFKNIIKGINYKINKHANQENVEKNFETLYKKYRKKYFRNKKVSKIKFKKLKKDFENLSKELLEEASKTYLEKISNDLENTTKKYNKLLNEANSYLQEYYGSVPFKSEYESKIEDIELPENLEDQVHWIGILLRAIFAPIILLYMALERIFKSKEAILKDKLKENFIKYFSLTEANEKNKDWKKKGGFFTRVKTGIVLPKWKNFWKDFKNNFNIGG